MFILACLSLVYRNVTDFCVFIFYNFVGFVYSTIFFLKLCFLHLWWVLISSVNRDNFTSSFPIWMFPSPPPLLIALARTSSIILNRSGKKKSDESGHSFLVLDLNGKAFNFSLLGILLVVIFSYKAFILLK